MIGKNVKSVEKTETIEYKKKNKKQNDEYGNDVLKKNTVHTFIKLCRRRRRRRLPHEFDDDYDAYWKKKKCTT